MPPFTQGIIAVLAVLLFVSGFSLGLGAVAWTIMAEIMPTRVRMKAVSLFLSLNWCGNLVISLTILPAINSLGGVQGKVNEPHENQAQKEGVAKIYIIFAGITLLSLLFTHFFVKETKEGIMESTSVNDEISPRAPGTSSFEMVESMVTVTRSNGDMDGGAVSMFEAAPESIQEGAREDLEMCDFAP